jgi:hypothetical protein
VQFLKSWDGVLFRPVVSRANSLTSRMKSVLKPAVEARKFGLNISVSPVLAVTKWHIFSDVVIYRTAKIGWWSQFIHARRRDTTKGLVPYFGEP